MILRFEYHILINDLCDYYRGLGYRVKRIAPGLVEVSRDGLADPQTESLEMESHLRAWEVLHAEAPAEIVR